MKQTSFLSRSLLILAVLVAACASGCSSTSNPATPSAQVVDPKQGEIAAQNGAEAARKAALAEAAAKAQSGQK